MATTADLLAEARAARHRILTMGAAIEVRDGNSGDMIRYERSNLTALERYIARLEGEIAGSPSVTHPLRLVW